MMILFALVCSLLFVVILLLSLAKVSGRISEIERAEQDQELIQKLLSQEKS